MQKVIQASGVFAATHATPDQGGAGFRGLHLSINMTVVPGVDTVTPHIQGKDAMGNYYDILVGPAIVAIGDTILRVGEGILAAANAAATDILPDVWRVNFVHSAGTNFTYEVSVNLKADF